MATYQSVLNNTWDDPVFQAWSSAAKLVFLNLITSHRQNPLGLYAVTKDTLMFETKLSPEEFAAAWGQVTQPANGYARVRFDEMRGIVWVVNTLKHQRGIVPTNRLVGIHIAELLRQHAESPLARELIELYQQRGFGWLFKKPSAKGLARVCQGAAKGTNRIGKERIGKEIKKSDLQEDPGFNRFWEAYPRKTGKVDALKAWAKLSPDPELAQRICEAVKRQSKWPQWVRDGGQFIPHPATWLNGRRWEDQEARRPAERSVADELSPQERARLKELTSSVGKSA